MFVSSVKEINRYVKHLLLRKSGVLKIIILAERKFEEMHYLWRVQGIFGETFILALPSSAVFRLQICVSHF